MCFYVHVIIICNSDCTEYFIVVVLAARCYIFWITYSSPFTIRRFLFTASYQLTLHLTISHYIILIFQFCYSKVKQSKFHFNLIIISFFSFLLPVGKVYFVPMIFQQQEQHNSSPPINHSTIYFYIILNKILIKRNVENEKPPTEIIS